jgi:methyl-accepting chemotaxis protein
MQGFKNYFHSYISPNISEENKENDLKDFLKIKELDPSSQFSNFQKIKNFLFQSGDSIALSILNFPAKLKVVSEFQNDFTISMEELAVESKNLAAHAEELDAVVQNLQENLHTATEIIVRTKTSSSLVNTTAQVADIAIQQTSSINESIIQDNKNQQVEMNIVIDQVKNIQNQIQLVREISDQTNLLSLNASIEAARAGELGAGFAVVAEGVSKLADKSKTAVQGIDKAVKLLMENFKKWIENSFERIEKINRATVSIEKTRESVLSNREQAESTLAWMENMNELFQEINVMINEMKSTSERVATSSLEMSQTIESLEEKDLIMKNNIDEINFKIQEASKDITNQNPVWLYQLIQARRTDHIIWVGKVRECIENKSIDNFPEVRHTHCKMGIWYYQANVINEKQRKIHEKMEEPHHQLHQTGKFIYDAIQNKEFEKLDSLWLTLNRYYLEIAAIFDEYEKFLENECLASFIGKK